MLTSSELWPRVTDELLVRDTEITERLSQMPVMDQSYFNEEEIRAIYDAAAGKKIVVSEQEADWQVTLKQCRETSRDKVGRHLGSKLSSMSGVVYMGLHSGWLEYKPVDELLALEDIPPLTPMQALTLKSVAFGGTRKAIADMTGLTSGSVKSHLARLCDYMNCCNKTELMLAAYEYGLFAPYRPPTEEQPKEVSLKLALMPDIFV